MQASESEHVASQQYFAERDPARFTLVRDSVRKEQDPAVNGPEAVHHTRRLAAAALVWQPIENRSLATLAKRNGAEVEKK